MRLKGKGKMGERQNGQEARDKGTRDTGHRSTEAVAFKRVLEKLALIVCFVG